MAGRLNLALVCATVLCHFAAGGLVTTETYAGCDPAKCKPPTCLCPSNSPPGGLSAKDIPQFVLIAHDNALDTKPYELMLRILGDKKQPNGCNVPVTYFAERYHSDCQAGQRAIARGDEVAMQTNRFTPYDPFNTSDPNPNYNNSIDGKPNLEKEITMSRDWWHTECKLAKKDMVGFRAPEYVNNPPIRNALEKNGWLYDNTLIERYYTNSPTSPTADKVLWPYTMDYGIPQECEFIGNGSCAPGEKHPGLWEVPLLQMQEGDKLYGVSSYGDTEIGLPEIPDMAALLKSQLDGKLAGGRVPMQVNTIYEWLSVKPDKATCVTPDDPYCFQVVREINENGKALGEFIGYALAKPEVRFVTYSDFVRWMQDPVPLSEFDDWVQCKIPGVKADLTAVKLSAADKAGAFYLTNGGGAGGGAPTGGPAPSSQPFPSPDAEAPSPEPGPESPEPAPFSLQAIIGEGGPGPLRRRMLRSK